MRGSMRLRSLLAVALALVGAAAAMPGTAEAQCWGFGYQPPQRRAAPTRNFFSFPFYERGYRSPYGPYGGSPYGQPVESSRAPPPRKLETQPTRTVVVIGDSLADWLSYGLEEVYADQPDIGVIRKIRPNSGLIHYEPRNDTLEWSQAVKDILAAEKPSAIVVMLGLNARVPLRNPAPPREGVPRKGEPPAQAGKCGKGDAEKPRAAAASRAARRGRVGRRQQRRGAGGGGAGGGAASGHVRISLRPVGAALSQARRRHDRRAQGQGRAGILGRPAGGARPALDRRHGLPRRPLSRRRRQGRHPLRRCLGRLCRRERTLQRAGSGLRRPDSPAAHRRRRALHQIRRAQARASGRSGSRPRTEQSRRAGAAAGTGSRRARPAGSRRGKTGDRPGAAARRDRQRPRRRSPGRQSARSRRRQSAGDKRVSARRRRAGTARPRRRFLLAAAGCGTRAGGPSTCCCTLMLADRL